MNYLYTDNPTLKGVQIEDKISISMEVFSKHDEYLKLHEAILTKETELGCTYEKKVEHPIGQEPYIVLTFVK